MPGFTFAFSYDKLSRVAWLTLSGGLDAAGLQRLRGLLRTIVGALAPGDVYVDVRDADLPGVASGGLVIRALRWFPSLSVAGGSVSRRDMIDKNPMTWLLQVDGFLVDARQLPPELQVQAWRRGLIPYVPAQSQTAGQADPSM